MDKGITRPKGKTTSEPPPPAYEGERSAAELKARIDELEGREALSAAALPKLGDSLHGGYFGGILCDGNGAPYALILLPFNLKAGVTWWAAMDWALSVNGDLPTCGEAHMLLKNLHGGQWHGGFTWTNEDYFRNPAIAWGFSGLGARTAAEDKSTTGSAFAVRRVPLDLSSIIELTTASQPARAGSVQSEPSNFAVAHLPDTCNIGAVGKVTAADMVALSNAVMFMKLFLDQVDASSDIDPVVQEARDKLEAAQLALRNMLMAYRYDCSQQRPC